MHGTHKENLNGALNFDTVVVNMNNIFIDKVLAREFSHIVCEVKIKEDKKKKYIRRIMELNKGN